jgi:hypothetical protein
LRIYLDSEELIATDNMLIASDEMRVVNVQTFAGPADVVQWSEGYPPESLFWKDFQDAGELLVSLSPFNHSTYLIASSETQKMLHSLSSRPGPLHL